MNNPKRVVKKLKEQKKMLEAIVTNSSYTEEQRKAIEEANIYLAKINSYLKIFGE